MLAGNSEGGRDNRNRGLQSARIDEGWRGWSNAAKQKIIPASIVPVSCPAACRIIRSIVEFRRGSTVWSLILSSFPSSTLCPSFAVVLQPSRSFFHCPTRTAYVFPFFSRDLEREPGREERRRSRQIAAFIPGERTTTTACIICSC